MDNKKEGRNAKMSDHRSHVVVNFLVRAVLGMA